METKCYCGQCVECKTRQGKCPRCNTLVVDGTCPSCTNTCGCGNAKKTTDQICTTCQFRQHVGLGPAQGGSQPFVIEAPPPTVTQNVPVRKVPFKGARAAEFAQGQPNMYIDIEGLKRVLGKVFQNAHIKPYYIDILLSDMTEYVKAFTAVSADKVTNYELYEYIGDPLASAALVKYLYKRFPQLHCTKGVGVLSRLKGNNISGSSWSQIAEELGFWPYIRASDVQRRTNKPKLLEDVFEAFMGVTCQTLDDRFDQIGVGFHVVYYVIQTIFDKRDISLVHTDVYDAKSRLKELVDAFPQLGTLKYDDQPRYSVVYLVNKGVETELARGGSGKDKPTRQKDAAQIGLDILEGKGYVKQNRKLFCE